MEKNELEQLAKAHRKYLDLQKKKSALLRQKKQDEGLQQVNVWVPQEQAEFLKWIAQKLRENSGEYALVKRAENGNFKIVPKPDNLV